MSMKGAIVTWAMGGSSLSAIRSLGKRGIRVLALDSTKDSPGFYSRYTHKAVIAPDYHTDFNAYKEFLQKICSDGSYSVILPMDEVSIYILSRYSSEFPNINVTWPAYEELKIVQDKEKLLKLAEELDIPTPKYLLPNGNRSIKNVPGIEAPWVLKPKYSLVVKDNKVLTGGVRYALNIDELNKTVEEMVICGQDPIIQEYIPGEGYGLFGLYNRKEIKAVFQHHRLRERSYIKGASSYRESVRIPELEKEGLKIPAYLGWHGPIMAEFRQDRRDGKFKLIEINPRFWGSLNLAICAGIDFPYLYYKMATEGDCEQVFNYRLGVRNKSFSGELSHLISILKDSPLSKAIPKPSFWKAFLSVLYSGFTIRDDYLSIDDLYPFIKESLRIVKEFLRYLLGRRVS